MVEFEIRNRSRKEPTPLYNVVAELKGSEKPDEYVVVCGHLDSWHQATGTTDNGTGTASTMEVARILTAVGARPKRTIRFCLWGGEEQGLLGSRGHVVMHRQEMAKVSACLNHDTGTNWCYSVRVTEGMYGDMQRVMAPAMTMKAPDKNHKGPVFKLSKSRGMSAMGSDHASFLSAGVPAWSWGLKGRADYMRYSWHSQWDTYDAAIPEYQRHTATVIALAALGIADLPKLLSREGMRARGGARGGRRRGQARPILEGYLGIELKQGGLVINSVSKDSLAQKSGLEPGDKIVKFNGADVRTARDAVRTWRNNDPPWRLTVQRGDKQVKVKLVGGQAPPQPRRRRR
ncbi:MAG: M20/M25/M40 family metallo-hydrolase [Planctomycetota bacterium]